MAMQNDCEYLDGIGEGRISRIIMGKLKIGVDLLEGIEELARREQISTGIILSGVGALKKGVFRNAKIMPPDYKMEDKYRLFLDIEKPLELVTLSGWIATTRDGERNIHAHLLATTVIDDKIASLGGHLVKGTITSIKVIVTIGVVEDTNIVAALDPNINQVDLDFRY
jgi:predicted DNA-binding protein with PD1-like motif